VTRSQADSWSIRRSLAFLAATFAIMFGTFLPSAVAASAAGGSPIMLCSGAEVTVVYDADGAPRPEKPSSLDSLTCASCILAAFTLLPPSPPVHPAPLPRIVAVQPALHRADAPVSLPRVGLRPPSTAPPAA
jgi:hypothetical protein